MTLCAKRFAERNLRFHPERRSAESGRTAYLDLQPTRRAHCARDSRRFPALSDRGLDGLCERQRHVSRIESLNSADILAQQARAIKIVNIANWSSRKSRTAKRHISANVVALWRRKTDRLDLMIICSTVVSNREATFAEFSADQRRSQAFFDKVISIGQSARLE